MIKKLYEEHFLEIDPLLTKESKRLKLTPNELVVLKTLFSMYKKRTLSVNAIAKKIELSNEEISKALDKLSNKGFITLNLEVINDKEVEVFDLNGTFDKITDLYTKDMEEEKTNKNLALIGNSIELISKYMGRSLSSFEYETISEWYINNQFKHELIIAKINEHGESSRFSVKFLERVLSQSEFKAEPVDAKADQAIDKIYKAMKSKRANKS